MKELQIVHDYKTLAIPLDMVAIPKSIEESKKILEELK